MENFILADNTHSFVLGRDGGLTDKTNVLTYSFIAHLYGPQGPYRKVLREFGIPGIDNTKTHLVFSDNHIYSDIELENKIYWLPSGHKLSVINGTTQLSTSLLLPYFPGNVINLIKKLFIDATLFQSISKQRQSAHKTYTSFTNQTIDFLQSKTILTHALLNHYQHVVQINYLYEFFVNMLPSKIPAHIYSLANDVLIGTNNDQYYEQQFIPYGFDLVIFHDVKATIKPHMPTILPFSTLENPHHAFVVELQTMKNNMRVQMTALMYSLALQLWHYARKKRIADISLRTINEIVEINPSVEYLYLDTINTKDIAHENSLHEKQFTGIACSRGQFTGVLKQFSPDQPINPNYIYLFPNPSPKFTQAYKEAPALVFKQGSALSHGAIVAREMKTPAIVITQDISHFMGKMVTIDGEKGTLIVGE